MELLISLVGEFILELAVVALAPLAAALILLVEAVLELIWKLLGLPSLFRPAASAGSSSRWPRRLGKALVAIMLSLGILVILLNTLFFESTLRWGLARAKEKTGVDIHFESARGNFLSGNVTLMSVTVRRQDSLRSGIDLKIKEAQVDVAMTSLYGSCVRLEVLRLSGVEGTYQRSRMKYPRRDFEIDHLLLESAVLVLKEPDSDVPAPSVPLGIDRLECRPLRRDSAVFDLLFRSNGSGTIAGGPFEIRTESLEQSRKSVWKAQAVPVGFLAAYVGEPFDWLTAGTVDVDVVDAWSDGPSTEIDTHWKLMFRGVSADVPARVTGFKRVIAEPVVRFIQAHPAQLPLEFQLKFQKGHFTGAASVETTGLVRAAVDGMLEELARRAKVPVENIKELGRRALDAFKKFVEERRRKKGED
jgi:hypothetical protein